MEIPFKNARFAVIECCSMQVVGLFQDFTAATECIVDHKENMEGRCFHIFQRVSTHSSEWQETEE